MPMTITPVKLALAVFFAWAVLAWFYLAGEALGAAAYHTGILA